ncbi:TIGR03032 family protein [soil metagenome]
MPSEVTKTVLDGPPKFEITTSRNFTSWLAGMNASIAMTTYQTGKIFFLGLQPDMRLSVFERTFNRAMGMYITPNELYLATVYQIWRFNNILQPGQTMDGYDRCYFPRSCWVTGDIDVHDMAIDAEGKLVFVNTLFGCVSTTDDNHSFRQLWKPPFISRLAPEDRCHLNGLALKDGKPKYVTAVSKSDVPDGWRDRRKDGGIVMDIDTNDILAEGMSMPHSPRYYRGKLWVLNSGAGYFGYVDMEKGKFEPVTFCPGYARGVGFHGKYAVIGLSGPRHNKTFSGLPLDAELAAKGAEGRCGLLIVDLDSGDVVEWLRIEGIVGELYDAAFIPGVTRPMAIGFKTDEIKRMISFE